MRSIIRVTIVVAIVAILGGGLIWGFLAGRKEQAAEAEREAPVEAQSRVKTENGETVLLFDATGQKANGIATASLKQSRQATEVQANGVVLQLQPLLDLKTNYNTASTELAKARATAHASEAEYERLRKLNQDGKNASDKAVEAAQATAASDAAQVHNAEQTLAIAQDSGRLHWGPVIADWLAQGSPQLEALLGERELLLQVTGGASINAAMSQRVVIQAPDGTRSVAHLLSQLPQLDPRLQAPSSLYAVASRSGLVPGMNLSVFLPSGPMRDGVVVPLTAVVWSQGKAWCYIEESPGKFARKAIPTANPMSGGWFVTSGIDAHQHIVVTGAQALLSEEFRSQIQTGEED
jgi:hypothetical protein